MQKELEILQITLPDVSRIPAIRFDEAKQRVAEKYDRQFRNPYDLEPEEEHLIGQYAKEEFGVILCLSHIIHPRNVRFMRWMIRQIRLTP